MDILPTELHWHIFEYMSRVDLSSLRLTCKDICRSIYPISFKKIDILPLEQPFDCIAANPEIQTNVRCVRYTTRIILTWRDLNYGKSIHSTNPSLRATLRMNRSLSQNMSSTGRVSHEFSRTITSHAAFRTSLRVCQPCRKSSSCLTKNI
jgi:hypothetical protein